MSILGQDQKYSPLTSVEAAGVSATTTMLDAALAYARRGWRVVPVHTPMGNRCSCPKPACNDIGKHPRITDWTNLATTDEALIRRWWHQWPDANVGIVTGRKSGIFVLDADAGEGESSLDALQMEYALLPSTLMVQTGGGGLHLYFAWPEAGTVATSAGKIAPGIDVRGEGGFVVAPPSLHVSGRRYEWL